MNTLNRRQFLQRATTLGAAIAGAGTLAAACTKKEDKKPALTCNDTTGMPDSAVQMRKTQNYVEKSPKPDKHCTNCQLYVAGPEGKCGQCTLFQNTKVHPKGYCDGWVAKQG